jgi:hypothetical protein
MISIITFKAGNPTKKIRVLCILTLFQPILYIFMLVDVFTMLLPASPCSNDHENNSKKEC